MYQKLKLFEKQNSQLYQHSENKVLQRNAFQLIYIEYSIYNILSMHFNIENVEVE